MTFSLTGDQGSANTMMRTFMADEKARLAIVTGFAGTGKTWLISVFASEFGIPVIAAPTGKAALRVANVTGLAASTIHRLIYNVEDDAKTGEPRFTLKTAGQVASEIGTYLLIDESSMVDRETWKDLEILSNFGGFKIVLMGDPFQLPPVQKTKPGEPPFSVLDLQTPYRVHMTEIVRQAADSPIIKCSMMIRQGANEGAALRLLNPIGESSIIKVATEMSENGGAVLVHRNTTRHGINLGVRKEKGLSDDEPLAPGEPLLVVQNNYRLNMFNGEIVRFKEWDRSPSELTIVNVRDPYKQKALPIQYGLARFDSAPAPAILATTEITGRSDKAGVGTWSIKKASQGLYRWDERYMEMPAPYLSANYGYCCTAHKAQGSEYPEILVILENSLFAMPELERRRWVYTSITRASARVSYVWLR